jgi:hypothetical protein
MERLYITLFFTRCLMSIKLSQTIWECCNTTETKAENFSVAELKYEIRKIKNFQLLFSESLRLEREPYSYS